MERPTEIIWFERIIIATLAVGVFNSWLAWPELSAMAGPEFAISTQLFTLAVILGLTLLISRRRSNVAKWISVAMIVIGLPFAVIAEARGMVPGSIVIRIAQTLGQAIAYALLFTPSARRWFKNSSPVRDTP